MSNTWYSKYDPFAIQVNSKKSVLTSIKGNWFSNYENFKILKTH